MIGWKSGHVGIFSRDGWDAPIIEMRSQYYDYQDKRTYKECGFTKVLYSPSYIYDESSTQNDDTKVGWHRDSSGWWYRHTEGTGPNTYYHETFQTINGKRYCFDKHGYICYLNRVDGNSETGWLY